MARPKLLHIDYEDVHVAARRVPVPSTGDIADAPCLNCLPVVTDREFVIDLVQEGIDRTHVATVYKCKVCNAHFYVEYTIYDDETIIDERLEVWSK